MARGVDLSALSRGERLVLAASGLLLLNAFIPWWFRVPTPGRTYWHNAGLTGWSALAVLVAFVTACAVLMRAARFPARGPADGLAYSGAGLVVVGALTADAARVGAAWIGLYLSLALGAGIVWAGMVRRAERRAGWI